MALSTDFNVDPYYDDYAESKNFYRVLFRPGYAVQAREVTQLQTILQKQVERYGKHTFVDGSVVFGCDLNYDNGVNSLKLETQFSGSDLTINNFSDGIITGATSNARARVVATAASTASDQPTLMIQYLSDNVFDDGETITVEGTTTQANTVSTTGASGLTGASGNGSVVSMTSGVFYVGGFFAFKDEETLILEKYNNTPSYRIGIQVTESISTSDSDTSLLDPAQGAYNYAAQGANRYKIELSLSSKATDSANTVEASSDENFYQLLKVDNGVKQEETKYPLYSELEKTLARRTFDESGDYTITPFNLQLATHQGITGRTINAASTSSVKGTGTDFIRDLSIGDVIFLSGNSAATATISGVANTSTITLSGISTNFDANTANQVVQFESKFSAGLDPGKAYVKGYEYESLDTKYVTVDKGRDTATVNSYGTSTSIGNKLFLKNANGFFDIAQHHIVDLHCTTSPSQNVSGDATATSGDVAGYGTTHYLRLSQTKIGTARIRDLDHYAASGNTTNTSHSHSDYVAYLYDVRTSNSKVGTVADNPLSTGRNIDTMPSKDFNSTTATFEIPTNIITIGRANTGHVSTSNYFIGGTTANTEYDRLATIEDSYVGATIKVTIPEIRYMIGDDTTGPDLQGSPNGITADSGEYHIALEHPSEDGLNETTGRIVLEANDGASPTSSNLESSISSTTATRTIVGHTTQRDAIILELDENLPKVPSFVACGTDDIYANGASFDGTGTALSAGSSVPGLSTSYEISFGIKDVDSISVSNNSIRLGNADVDELSRVGNLPTGNTILKETQFNSLIFPLPDSPLKMLANVSYTIKSSKGGLTDSSGTVTIAAGGTDKFVHASGTDTVTLTPSQAEEAFIVVSKNNETGVGQADTGVKVSNGQSLSFTSADQVDRQISVTGGSAVIKCNTGQQINVHVTFTATRTAQAGSGKIKTLLAAKYTNNYTAAGGSTITDHLTHGQFLDATPTREVGTAIELPTSDVFNLVKVVDSGDLSTPVTNAMMIDTANNITESYSLDTGQTDNYYGHSSIKLKPGKVPPSGQIVVVFDRFTHEAEDGFFSTNSYNTNFGTTYNGGQNTFSYSDIPSYTSPITGETNRLSDVVDFRPIVRDNSGTDSYDVATNTSAILVSTIVTPDPDTTTTLDYEYFLPRIDKLVLTRDRKFEVIKGKSSSRPVVPPDDEDSMTLYTLRIPAYTFALTDIETRYIDNKRFTMRDIGKLEKRIERLEYFTSLSILEKETEAREITSDSAKDSLFNDTGSRFKSGILVDPFAGHSIGDVSSDDYNAAVHFSKKQLRPPFYYDNFRFKLNTSGSNNVVQTGDLVTMPFANTTFVDQPLQSHAKAGDPIQKPNPFNILNYIGNVKLDPASDTWFDQTSRPEVTTNVEGHHDNWTLGSGTRQGFGTQWDDWSVNWSGKQINPEPNTAVSNSGSTTVRTRSTKLLSQNKTKFGIQSDNPVETIVKTVGPKVVDMSVVPFVRSQTVTFAAKGLKPLSNVYVFVDGTDMSANTEPSKKLVLSAANGVFQEGEIIKDSANNQGVVRISSNTVSNAATIFITDISGNSSATLGSPVSSQNNRISNSSIGFAAANVVTGLTSGANGTISTITANSRGILTAGISQMQTNDHGEISGDIDIPAGEFRTGDRLVRITDHANNELASTTTIAETLFKSKGVLQTRDNLIISTRELITRRESISTDEITRDTSSRQSGAVDYLNPQAQTFFVDANVFPLGVFLRNCTLFFATKDSNLPVTVQIRPVINGFPSASQIIPFSEVTLNPDMVVASFSNDPTGTVFSFESPVYLPTGEYAIVILSNSSEYMTYHGEVGENVVGTSRKITPQPFVGSYFIPSNGGEYKADPNKFLKFKLERCNFTGQLPGPGGANNFARFDSHANGANGNTANVNYQTFKVTTSTIEFSNTQMSLKFNSANTSGANVGFAEFNTDQNIVLANTRMMKMNSNGMFIINAVMSTTDSHVSPVIDIDRLSVITIENDIDDAVLAANDFTVTSRGSGYTNTAANGATATISSPNLGSNTATVNVHCEVTLTLSGTSSDHLQSGNSSYTVNTSTSGQFVVGEGIRTIVSTDAAGSAPGMSSISGSLTSGTGSFTPGNGTANRSGTNPSHLSNAAVGVITSQTFVGGNTSANTATITIKTSSNNFGVFSNGCFIVADSDAQETNMTNSGVSSPSKTFAVVSTVTGQVSNVMPWPAQSTSSLPSGTGYLTSPTVTISAPHSGTDTATAVVTGEDSASGGNINAKYISRRVTLEDGFDSKDLKVIINAYKPIESGIHVYYKVKSEEDPEDFDKKGYTLMTQETPSTVYSLNEEDTKEYLFKTTDESITYTSGNITYDTFKTFAIKIALTSNTASIVPKVRDMRAIALDV